LSTEAPLGRLSRAILDVMGPEALKRSLIQLLLALDTYTQSAKSM
jgi:hypothetical protein